MERIVFGEQFLFFRLFFFVKFDVFGKLTIEIGVVFFFMLKLNGKVPVLRFKVF